VRRFNAISTRGVALQQVEAFFDAVNYSVSDAQIEIIAQEYIQLLPDNNLLF
jgi:putative hydrolase of the HAD superfamily